MVKDEPTHKALWIKMPFEVRSYATENEQLASGGAFLKAISHS